MKSIFKKILLVIVPVILYGCATPPLPDLYWPEPPEPPRIKYIRAYRGDFDFKTSSVAADIILGAQGGLAIKKPMSVHVTKDGKVYVTDTANFDVLVFDPVNKSAETLNGMIGKQTFFKPIGVTSDEATGRVFITDAQTNKVTVLEKGVKPYTLSPGAPLERPTGIAADNVNRKLYITDTKSHDIQVYDLDTLKYIKTIGKRGRDEGEFNFPSHIAVDSKGKLYVTDTMNGRVQIFDPSGKFIKTFGQFGDAPGMFARPKGIGVDSEGHIYVVDSAFNVVQIFDQDGNILMAFSGYGNDRGQMILPAGLYVDKDDYIYVVDSWNRRVEVFEYLGEKHKAREGKATEVKK